MRLKPTFAPTPPSVTLCDRGSMAAARPGAGLVRADREAVQRRLIDGLAKGRRSGLG
jgi:hypothetical protein